MNSRQKKNKLMTKLYSVIKSCPMLQEYVINSIEEYNKEHNTKFEHNGFKYFEKTYEALSKSITKFREFLEEKIILEEKKTRSKKKNRSRNRNSQNKIKSRNRNRQKKSKSKKRKQPWRGGTKTSIKRRFKKKHNGGAIFFRNVKNLFNTFTYWNNVEKLNDPVALFDDMPKMNFPLIGLALYLAIFVSIIGVEAAAITVVGVYDLFLAITFPVTSCFYPLDYDNDSDFVQPGSRGITAADPGQNDPIDVSAHGIVMAVVKDLGHEIAEEFGLENLPVATLVETPVATPVATPVVQSSTTINATVVNDNEPPIWYSRANKDS